MTLIKLRSKLYNGLFTKIDDLDFDIISKYKWHPTKRRNNFYVSTIINGKHVSLHRLLMDLKHGDKRQVDHINGDTLDNQRCNLRICDHKENARNKKKQPNCASTYKGVMWRPDCKKWRAHINLGLFSTQEEAAAAYDHVAKYCFGEFARLNFSSQKTV